MRISVEATTDVGLVRELNEDSYRVIPEGNAVVVCDGMGGHAAGEVASANAADTISELVRTGPQSTMNLAVPLAGDWPPEAAHLAVAVRLANRRLYNEAARSHKLRGMGTTVVAAIFRPGSIITAHVGDSRVYRISSEGIKQLTVDHSWVAELLESGQVRPEDVEHFADKNVITRALGTRPGVQVDLGVHPAADGDIYLLCSDGLCGYVSDEAIKNCVQAHPNDLKAAAAALIQAANAAGGLDNCTVALVRIDESGSNSAAEIESVTLPEETEEDLTQLDLVLSHLYKEQAAVPEDLTEGHTGPTPLALEPAAKSSRAWQWLLLLALLVGLTLVLVWPRSHDRDEPAPAQTPAPTPSEPARTSGLGLLFVAPGTTDRAAVAYLDGVAQGTLNDLELGLLVEPGSHMLVVVDSAGDTLYSDHFELGPNDTLDLVVR